MRPDDALGWIYTAGESAQFRFNGPIQFLHMSIYGENISRDIYPKCLCLHWWYTWSNPHTSPGSDNTEGASDTKWMRPKCTYLGREKKQKSAIVPFEPCCVNPTSKCQLVRHYILPPHRWQRWAPSWTEALLSRPTCSGITTCCRACAPTTWGAVNTSSGRPSEPHRRPPGISRSSR